MTAEANSKDKTQNQTHLMKDISVIALSIAVGILIIKVGAIQWMLSLFESPLIAAFVAGIFFTSLLTIAPASIVLASLIAYAHPLEVAFAGALGAVVGDLILFYFVKDKISADIAILISRGIKHYHLDKIHSRYARWILPVMGAAVIASPLPDEIGIMLLGAAKMKTRYVIPVSFVMNFIGVLLVIALGEIVTTF